MSTGNNAKAVTAIFKKSSLALLSNEPLGRTPIYENNKIGAMLLMQNGG